MKYILTVFAIIPVFLIAQNQNSGLMQAPLIESITSDTVKGKYHQVSFLYDNANRVIAIINKEINITTGSGKKKNLVEKIFKKQSFQYTGTDTKPISRNIFTYQYLPSDSDENQSLFLESVEQQYFLYANEQRVGDSGVYYYNRDKNLDWNWEEENGQKRIGKLSQNNTRIYHEVDLTKPYSPSNIYSDEFTLTAQSNISHESSSYRYANRSNDASYYTYSAYDSELNPLINLNIASVLVNEKISAEFDGRYGKVDINWYFANQNNYTNYFVTTDEITSHYKYNLKFNYAYNKFKQPIYAKAKIEQVFNKGGALVRTYQQSYTFKYKKITQPPLIKSITSDTINGVFNQVLFSYDERNRVKEIVYKDVTVNEKEQLTKKEIFDYQGLSSQPYQQSNYNYTYHEKRKVWFLQSIDKRFFLYNLNKYVGDSTLFLNNAEEKLNFKWVDDKVNTSGTKIQRILNRIYQTNDLSDPQSGYRNIYLKEFHLTPLSNFSYELYENLYGNRGRYGKYTTITKVDSMLNPLKQLNIAEALCIEKVSFVFGEEEDIKVMNWYFNNRNNILEFNTTFDEQSSDYKNLYSLRYNYNQYNQPVYVKLRIKKVGDDSKPDTQYIYGQYQKTFTFRYK